VLSNRRGGDYWRAIVAENSERLADFKPWRVWVADDASPVFRTFSSFEWFVRCHRDRLVESGQLIPRSGPGGSLVGPRIDYVVLEIMREEGARTGGNEV